MRQRCIATILALGLCSNALALTYLGPPTTNMKAGQWAGGVSYADGEQDIELGSNLQLEDLKEETVLGRVAAGVVDRRWEVFGLFGAVDAEQDYFNPDDEFLIGFGTRITTNVGDKLDWGVVGQVTWFTSEDTGTFAGIPTPYELDLFDIQVGLGPCWRPGPFILYGGPMIQWIEGDLDTTYAGNFDVNAESWFGVYIGGGVELEQHLSITGEVQATGDATLWAVCAQWRF